MILLLLAVTALTQAASAPATLSAAAESVRAKHDLPALGVAVVDSEHLIAIAAVGLRERGKSANVTTEDRWHLGSCTKAMTASLCALLVEQGKLRWDQTIAETWPDLVPDIRPDYRHVTLAQLLAHRSGLPEDRRPTLALAAIFGLSGEISAQRRAAVGIACNQAPVCAPGAAMNYSNSGYAIAAAMAEHATGRTWEDLLPAEVFAPLGITTAVFGEPARDRRKVDQARGHRRGLLGETPIFGDGMENPPPALFPAGGVAMTLPDWGRFVQWHLRLARGAKSRLPLGAETIRQLQTPHGDQYAMGWAVAERDWAGGRVLTHAGSNGAWYCVVWIAPQGDRAYFAATNCGGENAVKGCDEAIGALIKLYPGAATQPSAQQE